MNNDSVKIIRGEILELVKQSKLDAALDRLDLWIKQAELKNLEHDLVILFQDYQDLKTDKLRNVISTEVYGVRENQLIQSLIALVEKTQAIISGKHVNISHHSKTTEEYPENIAIPRNNLQQNKGCLFALSNRRINMTLQIALASLLLIWVSRMLAPYINETIVPSKEVVKNTESPLLEFVPGSIEYDIVKFLDSDSTKSTQTFTGKGLINATQILAILETYPNSQLQIDNFSNLNLKELQNLQQTVDSIGIANSRAVVEDVSAFSSDFDFRIIVKSE